MRIIGRVNKLIIFIITTIIFLSTCPVIRGQVSQNRVAIFIIDSGIQENYLKNNAGINEKTEHGSLVAWIIKQDINKDNIKIIPIEVGDTKGNIQYSLYLGGLREIINYKLTHPRQRILVNISLGFKDRIAYEYIQELYDMGVQIVAAAGNNNSIEPVYPAGFSREVIAVANASISGKADSSNYGLYVDIAAPGSLEYIESIYFPGQSLNRKFKFSGTSFSAPRVTALLASLLVNDDNLSIEQAKNILEDTALPVDSKLYKEGMLGAGIINRDGALARVIENYRLQRYFGLAVTFFVIVLILIGLWQKYKVFSGFVFLLLLIVFSPFLLILKENIYNWTGKGKYFVKYLAIIIFLWWFIERVLVFIVRKIKNPLIIIKLLPIPFSDLRKYTEIRLINLVAEDAQVKEVLVEELFRSGNKSKSKILIKVLTDIENPPLTSLLHYASQNKCFVDFIATELASISNISIKKDLSEILLRYLNKNAYNDKKMAAKVLKKLEPEFTLTELLSILEGKKIDKVIMLEIIESYGVEAECAVDNIKRILQESKDMWTRYQAVRTLYKISANKEDILSYLENYINDQQQLVRLEVRELMKELKRDS